MPGRYGSANVTPDVEPFTASAFAHDTCGLKPEDFEIERAAKELRQDSRLARYLRYRISQVRVAIALFQGQQIAAITGQLGLKLCPVLQYRLFASVL